MTIKSNYYDGISVAALDDVAPWASLLNDGVYNLAGGALLVTQHSTPNLSVDVAIGAATKNGYYFKSDAIVNPTITANSSGFNRIDNVVANIDTTGKITTIIVVAGVPSSSPVAPTPTANQLLLATVLVGNNVSVINTVNITDCRVNVDILNSSLATLANPKMCKAYHSAAQSIVNNAFTALHFDSENFDTDAMHDLVTNNDRLICKTAGTYIIMANIVWVTNTVGTRFLNININGVAGGQDTRPPCTDGNAVCQYISLIAKLNINDYIQASAAQISGGALSVASSPYLAAIRVGA